MKGNTALSYQGRNNHQLPIKITGIRLQKNIQVSSASVKIRELNCTQRKEKCRSIN